MAFILCLCPLFPALSDETRVLSLTTIILIVAVAVVIIAVALKQ